MASELIEGDPDLVISDWNAGWRFGFIESGDLAPREWSITYKTKELALIAAEVARKDF